MRARDNPLTTDRLEALKYRFLDSTWPDFVESISLNNNRGAIVGREGAGKTTLLMELRDYLISSNWDVQLYGLRRDCRKLPLSFWCQKLSENSFVLLDGAEQLSYPEWKLFELFSNKAGGLVVTVHRKSSLPTLIECRTTADLFEELVLELGLFYSREELEKIYQKANGNVRLAFLELYDVKAGRKDLSIF